MRLKNRIKWLEIELEKISKESKKVKILFSEVPIGSVFFESKGYGYWNTYEVVKELGDLEQPTTTDTQTLWNGNGYDSRTYEIGYLKYVDYEALKSYGMEDCINRGMYHVIDKVYIEKVIKLRKLKTVKEIKEFVETDILK